MALTKEELLDLIDKNCTQQGMFEVSGPILKEIVENQTASTTPEFVQGPYIANISTDADGIAIATAVNAIIDTLKTTGLISSDSGED